MTEEITKYKYSGFTVYLVKLSKVSNAEKVLPSNLKLEKP
jgi:hypothetical protein